VGGGVVRLSEDGIVDKVFVSATRTGANGAMLSDLSKWFQIRQSAVVLRSIRSSPRRDDAFQGCDTNDDPFCYVLRTRVSTPIFMAMYWTRHLEVRS
jgi:hypothetical protein